MVVSSRMEGDGEVEWSCRCWKSTSATPIAFFEGGMAEVVELPTTTQEGPGSNPGGTKRYVNL